MTEIDAEYIKDAAGAMQRHCDDLGIEVPSGSLACALALAAAPHIAAAERERIRELALERGAEYTHCDDCGPVPFADLIGDPDAS